MFTLSRRVIRNHWREGGANTVSKMDETCDLILCKYWAADIIYWEASQHQIAGPSLSRLLLIQWSVNSILWWNWVVHHLFQKKNTQLVISWTSLNPVHSFTKDFFKIPFQYFPASYSWLLFQSLFRWDFRVKILCAFPTSLHVLQVIISSLLIRSLSKYYTRITNC
jgi:hypothetical protein